MMGEQGPVTAFNREGRCLPSTAAQSRSEDEQDPTEHLKIKHSRAISTRRSSRGMNILEKKPGQSAIWKQQFVVAKTETEVVEVSPMSRFGINKIAIKKTERGLGF
jgi:hypothetical protein